jgi:hypothetical protein
MIREKITDKMINLSIEANITSSFSKDQIKKALSPFMEVVDITINSNSDDCRSTLICNQGHLSAP